MVSPRFFRVLTWICVVALAVLSLLPSEAVVQTGLPGPVNHFVAYAGAAAIATLGYGRASRVLLPMLAMFCAYGGMLEYLQHFAPERDPTFLDFAASAGGTLGGGIATAILFSSLWKVLARFSEPGCALVSPGQRRDGDDLCAQSKLRVLSAGSLRRKSPTSRPGSRFGIRS